MALRLTTIVVKLSLLALCVLNAFGAPGQNVKSPFQIRKTFDDKFLTTPLKSEYNVYTVTREASTGAEVRLNSTIAKEEFQSCIQFDYYVNVPESHKFKYGLQLSYIDAVTGEQQNRFGRYGSTGDVWRTASLYVHGEKDQYLQYRVSTPSEGVVGFTQFRYDDTNAACKMLPYNSNFEDDSGPWEADVSEAHSVSTNDPELRLTDHSSDSLNGNVAVLESGSKMVLKNSLKKGAAKCLIFWYNQLPDDLADMTSRPFNVHVNGKTIWKSSAQVPIFDNWVRATVPLDLTSERNHFTIETEFDATEIKTKVAIDDIEFTEQACPEPVSCSFTDSICDWTNAYEDVSGQWHLGKGRVMAEMKEYKESFLPLADNGIYTDFTVKKPSPNEPLEIRSGFLPNSGEEYCATIDILHNRVNAADSFQLSLMEEIGVSNRRFDQRPLWKLNIAKAAAADVGKYHAETHQITVPASRHPRRLAFSVRSKNALSRFAVKAIQVVKGQCQVPATDSPTGKSKLPRETLVVAEELMRNSMGNIQRIIDFIKVEDPIKNVCVKLIEEMKIAEQQIRRNI